MAGRPPPTMNAITPSTDPGILNGGEGWAYAMGMVPRKTRHYFTADHHLSMCENYIHPRTELDENGSSQDCPRCRVAIRKTQGASK